MMGQLTVVDLYWDKGQHSGAGAQWIQLRILDKKRTRVRSVCRGDEHWPIRSLQIAPVQSSI